MQAATAPSGAEGETVGFTSTAAEIEALRAELTAAQAALAARGSDDTAELRRRIGEVADALARRDRLPQDRLPQAGGFPAASPALAES